MYLNRFTNSSVNSVPSKSTYPRQRINNRSEKDEVSFNMQSQVSLASDVLGQVQETISNQCTFKIYVLEAKNQKRV